MRAEREGGGRGGGAGEGGEGGGGGGGGGGGDNWGQKENIKKILLAATDRNPKPSPPWPHPLNKRLTPAPKTGGRQLLMMQVHVNYLPNKALVRQLLITQVQVCDMTHSLK